MDHWTVPWVSFYLVQGLNFVMHFSGLLSLGGVKLRFELRSLEGRGVRDAVWLQE